ncbi:FAD/NAD(P)-binding protein [Hahella ganghwensis]|uniref:FAD/NAD(P)-binding protein n=1 Tax=Hahella ganghwensis TaxID=286420 RepID=UPI00037628A4|nr:FAD/NAD(P)-binding protein [Hahella ganghwensis]
MKTIRIAIIGAGAGAGAGAGGIATLSQLADQVMDSAKVELHLFDPMSVVSPGAPYGKDLDFAKLNRPAVAMDELLTESSSFHQWLKSQSEGRFNDFSFAPRWLFGSFLYEMLSNVTLTLHEKNILFRAYPCSVTSIKHSLSRYILQTDTGDHMEMDHVVVAIGPQRRIDPYHLNECSGYRDSAFPLSSLMQWIKPSCSHIGVIGSSLTAIDAVLALVHQYPDIRISMLSRRGRLPSVRGESDKAPPRCFTEEALSSIYSERGRITAENIIDLFNQELEPFGVKLSDITKPTELSALDEFRQSLSGASAPGRCWQSVISRTNNALNYAYALMDEQEKQRTCEILSHEWLRQRIPVPFMTAKKLLQVSEEGRLSVRGGLQNILSREGGFSASFNNGESQNLDQVINASGFEYDLSVNPNDLIINLLEQGQMGLDWRNRGLVAHESCCVVDRDGQTNKTLQVIGAATQGTFLITSAVDVIGLQARRVARHIANLYTISFSTGESCVTQKEVGGI